MFIIFLFIVSGSSPAFEVSEIFKHLAGPYTPQVFSLKEGTWPRERNRSSSPGWARKTIRLLRSLPSETWAVLKVQIMQHVPRRLEYPSGIPGEWRGRVSKSSTYSVTLSSPDCILYGEGEGHEPLLPLFLTMILISEMLQFTTDFSSGSYFLVLFCTTW